MLFRHSISFKQQLIPIYNNTAVHNNKSIVALNDTTLLTYQFFHTVDCTGESCVVTLSCDTSHTFTQFLELVVDASRLVEEAEDICQVVTGITGNW